MTFCPYRKKKKKKKLVNQNIPCAAVSTIITVYKQKVQFFKFVCLYWVGPVTLYTQGLQLPTGFFSWSFYNGHRSWCNIGDVVSVHCSNSDVKTWKAFIGARFYLE